MKYDKLINITDNAVRMETDVYISITPEEAEELRKALDTINEYKKIAKQAFKEEFKYNVLDSDWCEFSYAVKNNKTIVNIRNGMAG